MILWDLMQQIGTNVSKKPAANMLVPPISMVQAPVNDLFWLQGLKIITTRFKTVLSNFYMNILGLFHLCVSSLKVIQESLLLHCFQVFYPSNISMCMKITVFYPCYPQDGGIRFPQNAGSDLLSCCYKNLRSHINMYLQPF